MYYRRMVLRAIGAGAITGVTGCSAVGLQGTAMNDGPRTVTDEAGREISLPGAVERAVAVGPGALRQVAYLGATGRIVGIEDGESEWLQKVPYNQATPGLREKPVIGSAGPNAGGNGEEILSVDPDVIFFYGDPSRAEALQKQTETPVVVLGITDFGGAEKRQQLYETWRLVGGILGMENRAAELEIFVEETIEDLGDRTADLPEAERATAYAGAISYKGAHGIATTRRQFPPFAFTNVENVASVLETDAASVQISEEKLLTWDPRAIFVDSNNLDRAHEDLSNNEALDRLTAVENGAVYTLLPHASYHHNYGSILANAYFVGSTLYPDRFDDVDLESKVNSIFERMLGAPLYDELIQAYDPYRKLEV
ncbi:ABC transporter substrate-binding protein [Halodesulfurarchaeum sp.]|uniref:ABC transporter substrate-binding protein n=1 Tax=Halodesulfurarchaeum sp. TaxID=1980530 RepID=UPI002FC322FE